jgi:diadenosine tetraphosphate (Ap4A) HIT family hydrolase
MTEKVPFDLDSYEKHLREGPCFVCAILDRHPDYSAHRFYEDEDTIAFLAKYPTLLGHSVVAPKRHAEMLVEDLNLKEYLRLQRVVYRVARAVSAALPTERVYVVSLGSQDGNSHVHWHVAPLPPGVPYEQQQHVALNPEGGVLAVTDVEMEDLSNKIRRELNRLAAF